jgi:hypothetical protein
MRMVLSILALTSVLAIAQANGPKNPAHPGPMFTPKGGFVPNEETAVKIAEAVLIPVYGEKQVLSERPFKATLKGDSWTVQGTLACAPHCVGGTALVEISKSTGQILQMFHTK